MPSERRFFSVSLLLSRPAVDPAAVTAYDWVHTFLQNGIFHAEVESILREASRHGITRKAIQDFLRDSWQFPSSTHSKQRQLHRIFDEKRRAADADKLKCSCSEALGVYGLVRCR